MKISEISLIFKKACFPAIMTIISFVLFVGVYLFVTVAAVEPYYFAGLLFAIPFVCFGIITFFTVTEKMKKVVASTVTVILIIVLGFATAFAFVFMSLDAATTTTTDISKYERVLKLTGYPNNELISCFPDKIPESAKHITFSYNPACLQGGENFSLKFETDSDSIKNYEEKFSHKAKWIGKSSDSGAEKNGVFQEKFIVFGYENLPDDFIIYLIDSKPYHPNDWNHGKISLTAISKQRNEILFLAEDW